MRTLLAQIISKIFGPEGALPLYLIGFLVLRGGLTQEQIIHLVPMLLFFDWLTPLISLVILIKLGKVSDLDVSKRTERPVILLIILASTAAATLFSFFWGNQLVFHLYFLQTILTFVLTLISFFYKISLHTALNTFLFLVVNYLYNWKFAWVLILLIPIAWARWQLKKHTLPQLVLGMIIGLVIPLTGAIFLL